MDTPITNHNIYKQYFFIEFPETSTAYTLHVRAAHSKKFGHFDRSISFANKYSL